MASVSKRSLSVEKLPWDLTNHGLKKYFKKFGKVESATVSVDPTTWASLGYGTVIFEEKEDAQAVAKQPHFIGGKMLDVRFEGKRGLNVAPGTTVPGKLLVRNLAPDHTDEDLYNYFTSAVGPVKFASVAVEWETGESRCCGHVLLADQDEHSLELCLQAVTSQPHFLRGKAVAVRVDGGPKDSWDQDRQNEVRVKGLPLDLDDEGLYKAFVQKYGEQVTIARVGVDKDTGISRGFGFVSFITKMASTEAIGQPIFANRKMLEVTENGVLSEEKRRAQDAKKLPRTLVVRRLADETQEEDLYDYLVQWGPVESLRIVTSPETGKSRGLAFVVFGNKDEAQSAVAHKPHFLGGRMLEMQFKTEDGGPGAAGIDSPTVAPRKIMARALPPTLNDQGLYEYFIGVGFEVESVRIFVNFETGASKCMGCVIFASEEQVQVALDNAHVIDGKMIELQGTGRDERRLRVLGVPYETTDERLLQYFSQCVGKVLSARVVKDETTGDARFGIVTLAKVAAAQAAMTKPHAIDGRQVRLVVDEPSPDKGKGKGKGWDEPAAEEQQEDGETEVCFTNLAEARAAGKKLLKQKKREEAAEKWAEQQWSGAAWGGDGSWDASGAYGSDIWRPPTAKHKGSDIWRPPAESGVADGAWYDEAWAAGEEVPKAKKKKRDQETWAEDTWAEDGGSYLESGEQLQRPKKKKREKANDGEVWADEAWGEAAWGDEAAWEETTIKASKKSSKDVPAV